MRMSHYERRINPTNTSSISTPMKKALSRFNTKTDWSEQIIVATKVRSYGLVIRSDASHQLVDE